MGLNSNRTGINRCIIWMKLIFLEGKLPVNIHPHSVSLIVAPIPLGTMKDMWNQRFQGDTYYYGLQPNAHFKAFIESLKPGCLLLPGEGEGRNAVYAAFLGWQVTAMDYSDEAQKKAFALAEKQGVTLNYDLGAVEGYQPKANTYDVIACIFLHLPAEVRHQVYQNLRKGLKPGGYFFVTGFTKQQLQYDSGGPKNEDWLFSADELEKELAGLTILRNQEQLITLDEGDNHAGEAAIVEFIGRKAE